MSEASPIKFGDCKLCQQGDLFAAISPQQGTILMCGECEALWVSPSDMTPLESNHSFRSLSWASAEQVEKAGWTRQLPEHQSQPKPH